MRWDTTRGQIGRFPVRPSPLDDEVSTLDVAALLEGLGNQFLRQLPSLRIRTLRRKKANSPRFIRALGKTDEGRCQKPADTNKKRPASDAVHRFILRHL